MAIPAFYSSVLLRHESSTSHEWFVVTDYLFCSDFCCRCMDDISCYYELFSGGKLPLWARIVIIVGAVLLIGHSVLTDIIGYGILIGLIFFGMKRKKVIVKQTGV